MDVNPAPTMPGQSRMIVSREALLENVRLIRRRLASGVKVCAMIKADAYGHGAGFAVDTLCNYEYPELPTPAVDHFAVASLDEAAALAEVPLPLIVLRAIENVYLGKTREAIESAIRAGWTLTLSSASAADDVGRIALSVGRRASIHVMIDTGMTRCGCSIDAFPELLRRVTRHASLKLSSISSHFATSEVPDSDYAAEQLARFRNATDDCGANVPRHLANSGGIFIGSSQAHFDMVRPGISLYGIDPTCRPNLDRPLKPVMRWVAPIISILDAPAGTSVGYGQTFSTDRDTRIGLVPVGYADGYFRCLGNRAVMIVDGKPAPVVGRVSMDLATIDLHDVPSARIGDDAIVLDNDPLSPASAYRLAELADTIPYEVFTRIGPRVKRVVAETFDASLDTTESSSVVES